MNDPVQLPRGAAAHRSRGRLARVAAAAALAAPLVVALLAGCAGEPLRYHSLRDESASPAPVSAGAAVGGALHVVQVGMPAIVDRAELVLATADGGYTIVERQRWSASASEEWRTALSARLARRLGARDIAGLGPRADEPVVRVRVMVRRLDSMPGRDVRLEADWTVTGGGGGTGAAAGAAPRPLACSTQDREPAGGDIGSVVEATRRLADRLADRIATAATAPRQGAPGC